MFAYRNGDELRREPLVVVNVGVEIFYQALVEQGVRIVHVDWCPPAGGDSDMIGLLDKLSGRGATE